MKTETYSFLGLDWPFEVPTSVEEYDQLAKRPGACVSDATDHTVYHKTGTKVREAFADLLEKESAKFTTDNQPVSRASGKKDAEGDDIELGEAPYVAKVLATIGKTIADFAYLRDEVLKTVKFDPSVQERKPGQPKKLPKTYLSTANELLLRHGTEHKGRIVDINALATKYQQRNPQASIELVMDDKGLVTAECLGKLIQADEARKRAETRLSQQVLEESVQE